MYVLIPLLYALMFREVPNRRDHEELVEKKLLG